MAVRAYATSGRGYLLAVFPTASVATPFQHLPRRQHLNLPEDRVARINHPNLTMQ